jgi:two-component system, LytTR family, response regulator
MQTPRCSSLAQPRVFSRPVSRQPITQESIRLLFPKGHRWVPFEQVVRLEGYVNYTIWVFADGTKLTNARTLKYLEARLPVNRFFRPHRKHLINRQHLQTTQYQSQTLTLTNGDAIPIARRRMPNYRIWLRRNDGPIS